MQIVGKAIKIPRSKFWYIEIPELDALTQAESLSTIETMAQDLVVCLLDNPKPKVTVQLTHVQFTIKTDEAAGFKTKGSVMTRKANYPIEPLILKRYSPRALSGEPITNEQLMTLFEAARWAPSSYNNQPWRFIYATRDGQYWQTFLGLLVEANRIWAKDAAALIIVASHNNFSYNNKPARTHSFGYLAQPGKTWHSKQQL